VHLSLDYFELTITDFFACLLATSFLNSFPGVGPLFLSPISEIPQIGRTYPYVISVLIFVAFQPPAILANNIQTLLVLRFFAGFVGSPVLATGGATIGDLYEMRSFVYPLGLWGASAGKWSTIVRQNRSPNIKSLSEHR